MDQIEPLFPIPLLRSPGLLPPALNEAAVAAIRDTRVEGNLRSGQLFHTEVADPRDNELFRQIAELAKLPAVAIACDGKREFASDFRRLEMPVDGIGDPAGITSATYQTCEFDPPRVVELWCIERRSGNVDNVVRTSEKTSHGVGRVQR